MAGKRTTDEVVDGVYMSATHCARCDKPFAPYGVAVPSASADSYCWGADWHRSNDLEKLVRFLVAQADMKRDTLGQWWADDWSQEVEIEDPHLLELINELVPAGRTF